MTVIGSDLGALGQAIAIIAGCIAVLDALRTHFGFQFGVSGKVFGGFLRAIVNGSPREAALVICKRTLNLLRRIADVVNIASLIAMLLAAFLCERIAKYIFAVSHYAPNGSLALARIHSIRFFLTILISAMLVLFAVGVVAEIRGRAANIANMLTGLLGLVAILYLLAICYFAIFIYPPILTASLANSPKQVLYLQLLMFPLNSMAFTIPAFILSRAIISIDPVLWSKILIDDGKVFVRPNQLMWRMAIAPGVTISFLLTALAAWLGSITNPASAQPYLTTQLYLVNMSCDSITLVITMTLLGWIAMRFSWPKLFAVIIVDSIAGCSLAVASLYLGLIGSPRELNLIACLHVLIGRDPSGSHWQFGSNFWVMHTSFLPTLAFWFFTYAGAIIRLLVAPLARVLGLEEDEAVFGKWAATLFPLSAVLIACGYFMHPGAA